MVSLLDLRARARSEEVEAVVEDILDWLTLRLPRPPILACIGGSCMRERKEVLDRVEAKVRAAGGRGVVRVHAGLDPVLRLPTDEAVTLLIEEAACAPGLAEFLSAAKGIVVISSSLDDWALASRDFLPARTFALPPAVVPEAPLPVLRDQPAFGHLAAVCALGLAAPVRLIERLSGQSLDALIEAMGMDLVSYEGVGGERWVVANDRRRWRQATSEGRLGLSGLAEAIARIAGPEESAVVLAMLWRLELEGRRDLASRTLSLLGSRLPFMLPRESEAVVTWAQVLRQLDQPWLARRALDTIAPLNIDNWRLRQERSLVDLATGEPSGLAEADERAEIAESANAEALVGWSRVAEAQGRRSAADRFLRGAMARDPNDPRLLLSAARLAARRGILEAAESHCRAAEAILPACAALQSEWGHVLAECGEWSDAAVRVERAARMEPWNARHRITLARLRLYAGAYDAAAVAVREALILMPDSEESIRLAQDIELARSRIAVTTAASRRPIGRLRQLLGTFPSEAALKVWRIAREGAGRVLTIPLPPTEAHVPLGLAADAGGKAAWVAYGDETTAIALTESARGELVATVEARHTPVEGAVITLVEVDAAGTATEHAVGVTGPNGEVSFGPVGPLEFILAPSARGRCRLRVVFPPEPEES
jgi:tetratricopeptide (TPR) repeat protein